MMPGPYDYFDRPVVELLQDDVFTLSAVRTWVSAARSGRCAHASLRGGFAARQVDDALFAFLCAMTLVDRHGYGTMRFAPLCYCKVSDDEARILTLFAAARTESPRLIRIAASLVDDDMAAQLAGAATRFGSALRLRT
ncbi:hypothetical protein [Sphingomonas sp.]|uniref:hypothetical protein n=1 Tax=Sphingomonas sp. TaxID=28214 RepID=UPI0031D97E79